MISINGFVKIVENSHFLFFSLFPFFSFFFGLNVIFQDIIHSKILGRWRD
jgi:hypothetical protein